jgi:hAT family C-terminal dimerisation region
MTILTKAGKIAQDLGYNKTKCTELLSQIRKYKLQKEPYNLPYDPNNDTPLLWWNTCYDKNLQDFAIKIFSIIPNSASCERIFSILGWMFGKRRQRLNIESLESMAKIHRYLISNSKSELSYIKNNYTNEQISQLINDAYDLYEQDFEEDNIENLEDNNDNDNDNDNNNDDNNDNIYHILSIEEIVNLHNQMLVNEPLVIIEMNNNELESDNNMEDYNPNDLAIIINDDNFSN